MVLLQPREALYVDAVQNFDNAIGLRPSDHFPDWAWKGKSFALLMDNQASRALKSFTDAIAKTDNNSKHYLLWLGRGIARLDYVLLYQIILLLLLIPKGLLVAIA